MNRPAAAAALDRILAAQEQAPRGPVREGIFALWLVARVAWDAGAAPDGVDRAGRRRVALLRRRLTSLTVPLPLGRGIAAALGHLEEAAPASARIALSQLVAPVLETLGPELAEAIAVLARELHTHPQGGPP